MTDTFYDDGEGNQVNYFKNIELRGIEAANKKIQNSQRGFIANDNIDNNNQE